MVKMIAGLSMMWMHVRPVCTRVLFLLLIVLGAFMTTSTASASPTDSDWNVNLVTPSVRSSLGQEASSVVTDQQVVLAIRVYNNFTTIIEDGIKFIAIVQITNSDDIVEYLQWQSATMQAGGGSTRYTEITFPWKSPEKPGFYAIKWLAISSLDAPELIALPAQSNMTVIPASGEHMSARIELAGFASPRPLQEPIKEILVKSIADYYKNNAKPFDGLKYELLTYQMSIVESKQLQAGSWYRVISNATAKIRNIDAAEKYSLVADYNSSTGLSMRDFSRDEQYLPPEVRDFVIKKAAEDKVTEAFFAKFDVPIINGSASLIEQSASYLEYSSLPSLNLDVLGQMRQTSDNLLVVSFYLAPELPEGEGYAAIPLPRVIVYLDPDTYQILATEKHSWT